MRLTCSANSGDVRFTSIVPTLPSKTSGVAARGPALAASVERGEEVSELVELFRRQVPEGGHYARADFDRANDRGARDALRDVRQLRPRPVVAVLAQLVAGEAARRGDDLLAALVARRDLHVDLGRRAPGGPEVGEVGHRR